MNRGTLRSELSFLLNVEESAADQAFGSARLNKALDQSYEREFERAKQCANVDFVKRFTDGITWPAGALRFTLPPYVTQKTLSDIYDLTSGEPGVRLVLGVDFGWANEVTLQWSGTTGPNSAKPLRIFYEAVAEPLVSDESEPELIPPQFHQLIVWSAACTLKTIADERIPQDWMYERNELRMDFMKHISKGRPTSSPPVMQGSADRDAFEYFNY